MNEFIFLENAILKELKMQAIIRFACLIAGFMTTFIKLHCMFDVKVKQMEG